MRNRERQRANRRLRDENEPQVMCNLHTCAGNRYGYCRILESNNFGDRLCPFYKTAVENQKEQRAVMSKLIAKNRQDLIQKYYRGMKGGANNGC